jgi:hypothetical protein
LLFGDAWYRDCPGVIRVRNLSEAKAFFERYQHGFSLDPQAFERFIEAISRACFKGMADFPPTGYDMDEKENIENLAALVRARLPATPKSGGGTGPQQSRLLPDFFDMLKRQRSPRSGTD